MHGLPATAFPAAAEIDHPRPVDLSTVTLLRRTPVRPLGERGAGFDEEFDSTTLFFDAFWAADGRTILLIGPPLLNLAPILTEARITALPSGSDCTIQVKNLDRQDRAVAKAPAGTTELLIESRFARIRVPVGENLSDSFAGRRVLLTLQRDNPIAWVLDWVRYHRDRHGADAVLIYDNGSTAYRPEDLRQALGELAGVVAIGVVSWPFKYGPQGLLTGGWDSDYCQLGALEHARWRYLSGARSVMNGDVDELVVAPDGARLFEAAERSFFGLLRYDGVWIMGIEGADPSASPSVRHRDYGVRLRPRHRWGLRGRIDELSCFVKWTAVPARCPKSAQWGVHRILGWNASLLKTGRFGFRHFRQINTQWKYDRTVLEPFDPRRHVHDTELASAYADIRWHV